MIGNVIRNKVRWGILFLILLSFYITKAQNFYIKDTIKLQTSLENGYFKLIHSKETIAYYWHSVTSYDIDSIVFFTYNLKKSKIKWYKIPSPFCNIKYAVCSSMAIEGDRLLILGPYNFYIFIKQKDSYHLIKTVKLKHKTNSFPDKIYFLDSNIVFLATTYDYANRQNLWSNYNFYWYNISKDKYLNFKSLNIGKGINFCYYPLQVITNNSYYLAISYITKPIILLFSKRHTFFREVELPAFSLNTDSIIGECLTDSILETYRYNPKNKIEIINKNKLYQYPSIKKISFINNDTLMCVVNTSFNDFSLNRTIYLYSVERDSIVKSFSVAQIDKNIPRTFFMTSGQIQFINEYTSYIDAFYNEYDDNVEFVMYLYKYTDTVIVKKLKDVVSIVNFNNFTKNVNTLIDLSESNIVNFTFDYKGNKPKAEIINDYNYVIWINDYFCASCHKDYETKKFLIIINNANMDITQRTIKYKYYHALFPKSMILFLEDSFQFNKQIINKLLKIRDN